MSKSGCPLVLASNAIARDRSLGLGAAWPFLFNWTKFALKLAPPSEPRSLKKIQQTSKQIMTLDLAMKLADALPFNWTKLLFDLASGIFALQMSK
jgi:hypothetical protein